MRLKGLKMQGFKSFADKIELDFSEGITAIVGPNGSGKSNISDAVRWVLGEQSAKMLRGSKMEDVIFNGTQTRKRLGFAEVTLELDNHDRHFNVNFDDVAVTRKVFASGESQYFMNGTPCRLKDIHEVFMDTGLGRDGYSMIGQGKIDEILSSKSEDRRQIFEEAAGISKYRYRKEEAERRLKHTDENLDRVADIITELETQIGPLTQQAEKAKKYLNLRDRLKLLDVNLALRITERSREQTTVLAEKLQAVTEQLTTAEAELAAADSAQEACYNRFEELDTAMANESAALEQEESAIVIAQREIEVLKNTIEGNTKLLERIEKETADLAAGKLSLEQNLCAEEGVLAELREALLLLQNEKKELAGKITDFESGADTQSEHIEALKQEITAGFDLASESKIALSNVSLLEENLKTRHAELQSTIAERKAELQKQAERRDNLDSEYARKTEFVTGLEDKIRQSRAEEDALQKQLEAAKKQFADLQLSVNQKKTRLHLLSEMEQNFEGYYRSVKEIMKQHENGSLRHVGIHGPVSKLLAVDKPYAAAIGAAIGGALQNIVVDTEEDAKQAISFLKDIKAGRATFMPISAVSGSETDASRLAHEPGFVGIASQLISYDSRYDGIMKNLLGKTVVMRQMDQAIALSRKYKQTLRIVTLDGEIFYPGGSIAGGSQQKGNQLLGREQEIKELESALARSTRQFESLTKAQKDLESQLLDLAQEQEKMNEVYRENKEVLAVLTRDKEHHDVLLTSLSEAIAEMEATLQNAQTEAENLARQKQEAAQKLAEAEKSIADKRAAVNELEQSFEAYLNQKQKMNDAILEKGFAETAKEREIEQCCDKMRALQEEIEQAAAHMALRKSESDEICRTNEAHRLDITQKERGNEQLNAAICARREAVKKMTVERQEAEQKLRSLQGNVKNTREVAYSLKTERERLEHKREKLEQDAETAVTRLWDEYEITYSEAEGLKQDLGTDSEMTKEIGGLRAQIRSLGNVNVDAIEELTSVSERYSFLSGQRNDLQKAKQDLIHIIEEMQTVMKRQFKEQFDKINQHFKTTFAELFGGGKADLSLEDENNVLECGIHINVQPPGKKLQSLSLLSGGERALSAIALLFAILRIKPTPFCFLDEIEAALDENNVYRYADFIKRFSRNTQFILVTHRRGTMECADVIYGVTMQEKGVSKLLALNLDEIEA